MIWSGVVGLFILLTEVAKSGSILPRLVILGVVSSTAIVGLKPIYRQGNRSAMTALEERIINLEVLYTNLP